MTRSIIPFSLLILVSSFSVVDAQSREDELRAAFREGIKFKTDLTVRNSITAQAVLIPYPIAKRIFGKEIAKSYAVIEVNMGNKNRDAAFILHGLFLDYSNWALSGYVQQTETDKLDKIPDDHRQYPLPPRPERLAFENQASTQPSQVASVEYRLARAELLDAQQFSARNWTVRLLTLAGTVASGYSFSFKEKGIAKGIAAFSGSFVPGVAQAWPDSTIAQLNNVSDFGYQTNKVVTKEDGEIVVAFFPIDRFLTPGLRKLFLQSPAVFFNPFSIFYDKQALKLFQSAAPTVFADNTHDTNFLNALPSYTNKLNAARISGCELVSTETERKMREAHITGCTVVLSDIENKLAFLNQASLNTIHIVVDGIMTVDVSSIPGKIDTITIDKENDPATWSEPGTVSGVMRGSFLGGAHLKIAEADTLGITDIATIGKDSNDQVLHFTMKLTKPIKDGTELTISVVKTDKQGRSFESTAKTYKVQFKADTKPDITDVKRDGDIVTVTGKSFFTSADKPLKVSVATGSDKATDVKDFKRSATEISFDAKPLDLQPACYAVTVTASNGASAVGTKLFPQLPSLELTSATKTGAQIVLAGKGFVDLKNCGVALNFQIQQTGSEPKPVANPKIESAEKATFDVPSGPATAKYKVTATLGQDKKGPVDVK
jgi:hypothetical protein